MKTDEHEKFVDLVDCLLTVPHEEMRDRELEYKRQSEANPNRRGPKRGAKKRRKKH